MKKFEMLNIICKDCELTAKEKLVAQYFVYKSNKAGACYPCVDKIAEDCSVSRRTVQRATRKLAEKEYIIKEERFKLGRQTSNLYSFNILLLEQTQHEKEVAVQEEDKEEAKADATIMEVIELEELLNMENQEYIDLDDLISRTQEDDYIEIECVQEEVPFKDQEQDEVTELEAVKQVQQEQMGKEDIFFSVSLLAWFCILQKQEIKITRTGTQVEITIIIIRSNSRASRKIFPP